MTEIVITGDFSNSGTVTGDTGDAVSANGAVTANITNSGTISDGSGGDTIHIEGLLTGTINNTPTGIITNTSSMHDCIYIGSDANGVGGVTGGLVNSGLITGSGTAIVDIAAGALNITNNSGGIISGTAPGVVLLLANTSTTGSTITNAGTITNSGAGGLAFFTYQPASATDSIINSGTINLTGGGGGAAFAINGLSPATLAQFGLAPLSGAATVNITNSGTISANETGSEAGDIEVFNGTATIINERGGHITNSGGSGSANAIAFIGSTASGSITNDGTIAHKGGTAIDDSLSGTSHSITNSGTINGNIVLSPQSDIVTITGGAINGDIIATAAGHGTVDIALAAGSSYTASGFIGNPAGIALAAVNLESGTLSVNAADINANSVTFSSGSSATLIVTGNLASFHNVIAGWSASGGIIDLANTAATAASVNASNQLVVTDNGAILATFALSGSFTGATVSTTSDGAGGTDLSVSYSAAAAISNAQAITAPVQITDTSADLSANFDGLQTLAAAGMVTDIKVTDSGIPTISITASQVTSDEAVIKAITGYFSLDIAASGNDLTIAGPANALGNTVVFSGSAASYTITAAGDGVDLTVAGAGGTDHLSNIQALQFSDYTVIVAQTPGSSAVTSGNITELYSAVFGRLPDVAGLAYYENELAANPSLPLTLFAQDFLASPEYTLNSAHNYAQTTAGDTQFITDLYENLLHRAPATGDAAWYEANVIAPIVGTAAPASAAYTTALALAHAYVVTDFSQSPEFLNDVQVTPTNPASAQHWLVLI